MITTFIAMQNAISERNNAMMQMYANTNQSINALSFGRNAQIMHAYSEDIFEMQNKVNETKVSILNRWLDSLNEQIKKSIDRSIPQYAGLKKSK